MHKTSIETVLWQCKFIQDGLENPKMTKLRLTSMSRSVQNSALAFGRTPSNKIYKAIKEILPLPPPRNKYYKRNSLPYILIVHIVIEDYKEKLHLSPTNYHPFFFCTLNYKCFHFAHYTTNRFHCAPSIKI